MSKFNLTKEQIKENITKLQAHMQKEGVDYFYVSSFDAFLNEYVPMSDCHRYYFTGFSGSVAESLVPATGKVKVYVDGRYHEQADLECDLSIIEVVKVETGGLNRSLREDLEKLKPKNLAFEANRTNLSFYKYMQENYNCTVCANEELHQVVTFADRPVLPKIEHLSDVIAGSSTEEKLKRVFSNDKEAYFVSAIDSLAWITNCRGYHLPYLSSFLGRGLVTKNKVFVFIDKEIEFDCNSSLIEFIQCDGAGMKNSLKEISTKLTLDKIYIESEMLSGLDYMMLSEVFTEEKLYTGKGLVPYQSIKTKGELDQFRSSFKRSNKAIFDTINWVKKNLKEGQVISELDLNKQTAIEYEKQGARTQSFSTISGVGPNGSIIHYSDPKDSIKITEDDMVLLDSGGYFESGFATDTTRTFMAADKIGNDKYREIYTLVLKGTLALQNAVFNSKTMGGGLDAITRQPLFQAGHNYAHGTGHGVGIHVHESGVRIGPADNQPMKAGQVVSIEPGIYLPGIAGVRLENIGIVVEHPELKDFLKFENLVYIGFDPLLIDESLLNEQEVKWLNEYEAECAKRGTSFRS